MRTSSVPQCRHCGARGRWPLRGVKNKIQMCGRASKITTPRRPAGFRPDKFPYPAKEVDQPLGDKLELELIQSHMAQKPVLRGEVGCACVAREVSVERGGMGERLGGWVWV